MSSQITLSDRTLGILKKLTSINQSLLIKAGEESSVRSANESGTIAAFCAIEESLPEDFCVYDLGEFLSVHGIVESPSIKFEGSFIVISSEDETQKLRFQQTAQNLVTSYFTKDLSLDSEDIVIKLPFEEIQSAVKAARSMRLEFAGLRADGEKVSLVIFNRRMEGDKKETNSYSSEISESDEVFDIFFPSEYLRIMDDDTTITIERDELRISVECGDMSYAVALDLESTFG